MRLSAPIYRLKRHAKTLSHSDGIPLHAALDRIARKEGYQGWSHLVSAVQPTHPVAALFDQITPGDLVLLGARPGHGKTLAGLELAVRAAETGQSAHVFSLDYTEADIADRLRGLGLDQRPATRSLHIDTSDEISADYIIDRLDGSKPAFAVMDYLQLLDQKRRHPSLDDQIRALKRCAATHNATFVLVSQIDRTFDSRVKPLPDARDIRLPNPLDLTLFDKMCFLHDGEMRVETRTRSHKPADHASPRADS